MSVTKRMFEELPYEEGDNPSYDYEQEPPIYPKAGMNIREELRYAAENRNNQLSAMALTIVYWSFCFPSESPSDLSEIEESIFLLLCAEAL